MRRALKLTLLSAHTVLGILLTLMFARQREGEPPSERYRKLTCWWHHRTSAILGLKVTCKGTPFADDALFVANHISWLDIPLIGGLVPIHFLSKSEVRSWPLLGWLAARSGTLFIQRGGKNAANAVAEAMTFQLKRKRSVLIFPEGTTSDGKSVRRFHPRLLGAAILAHAPIQPVAIRYLLDGKPHPTAPFIDDHELPPHLWQILGEKSIQAEITFLAPLSSRGADRKTLADSARERILRIVDPAAAGSDHLLNGQ